MGQSVHRLSTECKARCKSLRKPFTELVQELPVKILLELGHKSGYQDYAFSFYYSKQHPKFHLNREALRHAVRLAWTTGLRQDRMLDVLESHGYLVEVNLQTPLVE